MKIKNLATFAGLFCFSVSLLMAEVTYARTARVAFGYTYQLLGISIAISGIGFGGIPAFLALRKNKEFFERLLVPLALIYSMTIPVPFLMVNKIGVELAFMDADTAVLGRFFAAVFLVYLVGGIVIAAYLRYYSDKIPAVYSLSLLGSALGAFLVAPLMDRFGNEWTVVFIYTISLIPLLLFASRWIIKAPYIAAIVMFALLSPLVLANMTSLLRAGGLNKRSVYSTSNSFSQIDVFRAGPFEMTPDLSVTSDKSVKTDVKAYTMIYDRLKKANVVTYDKLSDAAYLSDDLNSLPYTLKPNSDVLIVGAGGGVDVVRARLAGSKKITAVELNPLIVDIAREKLKTKAFDDESVDLVVGEGRTFISRSDDKYDLIVLPLVGGPSDKGVNTRYDPDNYLNTRDAYVTYLSRLSKNGVLAVSNKKWIMQEYLDVGISALEEQGGGIEDKVAFIEGNTSSLALFKTSGFSRKEKRTIYEIAQKAGFEAGFPKTGGAGGRYQITDDRPFLSENGSLANIMGTGEAPQKQDVVAGSDVTQLYGAIHSTQAKVNTGKQGDEFLGLRFLVWTAAFALMSGLLILAIPPFFRDIRKRKQSANVLGLLGYFACLGVGFIAFQLVMLQKSFLVVGHPAYSIAVVLSSFMLFGGLGSLATKWVDPSRFKGFVSAAVVLLISILLSYAYLMDHVFMGLLGLESIARILTFVGLLSVPCFLSGLLFPIGLRATDRAGSDLIPWMWSMNGLAVVFGGALSALLSYFLGFGPVLVFAAVSYLAALIVFLPVNVMKPVDVVIQPA